MISFSASSLIVATAVCGNEYLSGARHFVLSVQKLAPYTKVIMFYSTDQIESEFRGTNLISLRKWDASGSHRFSCADAKFSLHSEHDDVLWLDLDTTIVRDFRQIVHELRPFEFKWAAICPESISTYRSNWYRDTPYAGNVNYYKPLGLNTGVVLFNTTRWRNMKKTHALTRYDVSKYNLYDQDVMNIYFENHREELAILSMSYNYRGAKISGNSIPIIKHYPGTGCSKNGRQCN